MDGLGSADILRFEGFRFDGRSGGLFRLDQAGLLSPIALGSRTLALLALLVRRNGELVSKDEIMAAVWPGRAVEEANLNVQISKLRHILDRNRSQGSCIQTVIGYGYRFTAEVTPVELNTLPDTCRPLDDPGGDAMAEREEPCVPDAVPQAGNGRPLPAIRARFRLRGAMASALGVLSLVAFLMTATNWSSPRSVEARFLPPPLSIIVLPFANLSDDHEQQYFADGITEDLTTDLSRVGQMFVISHNTALTFRNKPMDTKRIGRELGVRYVLEGGVQRSSNQLRVNAQLSDAEEAANLWAERFDGDTGDRFALQNGITRRIAVALNLEMIGADAARPTQHPDAFDYILRGRALLAKPPARETRAEAIALFERALALDPRSVAAQSWLARTLAAREPDQMTDAAAADVARAEGLVEGALAASPRNALAHYARGTVLRAKDRFEEAIPEYELAIESDRNWLDAYANLGQCKFYTGLLEEYIPLVEQAIRLSPRDPMIGVWFGRIGLAHLLQSHFDEAIHWLEKARIASPALPYIHARLASALALKGEANRAAVELAEARSLSRDDHYSSIARLNTEYLGISKIRALYNDVYFPGLRKAGMPEE
jgi:TolB-like protein/DNA-binding winged helix-turn-helix (wHTH) protein/tetratricopeptide (TPR) repeat protein